MSDQCIQYNEEMVGAGHPTKSDTLNRLALVEHNTDGTHKYRPLGFKSGLACQYKDADEITIRGGVIDINGLLCRLAASLDKQFAALAADSGYWVYAAKPSGGNELAAGDFSASTTAPAWSASNQGFYNGNDRCIFGFATNGSGGIRAFYNTDGRRIEYAEQITDASAISPSNSWTDITHTVPKGIDNMAAIVRWRGRYLNTNTYGLVRKNGSSDTGRALFDYLLPDATYQAVMAEFPVDANGKTEVRFAHSTINEMVVYTLGFILPEGM